MLGFDGRSWPAAGRALCRVLGFDGRSWPAAGRVLGLSGTQRLCRGPGHTTKSAFAVSPRARHTAKRVFVVCLIFGPRQTANGRFSRSNHVIFAVHIYSRSF